MSLKTHAWRWALAAGLLAAGLQLGLRGSGVATAVLHLTVQVLAVACAVAGLRIHRPVGRMAWYLLLAGMVVYLVADAIWYHASARGVAPRIPYFADALYVSAYLLVVGGAILIMRARTGGRDRGGFLEVLAITAGVGTLVFVALIDPYVHDASLSSLAKVVAISYPLLDLLFLAVVARIAFFSGDKPVALWLLAGFLLAQFTADSLLAVRDLAGTYSSGSEVDALWLASFAFFGAAALHPSMRTIAAPARGPAPRGVWRMAAMGGAALLGFVALALHGAEGDFRVLLLIVMVTPVAVFARMHLLTVDIETHRRTEEELRESEERFRRLSDGTFEGIIVVADGRIVEANRAFIEMFGVEREQVMGLAPDELIAPESLPMIYEHLASGNAEPWEMEIILRDGRRMWHESRASSIPFGGSEARVVSIRDITERKEAEERVRVAEARHRTLVEQLPAFIYIDAADPTSSSGFAGVYASPQIEEMFGYTSEEFVADPELWTRMLHPDDRARQFAEDVHLWSTGEPYTSEYRLITRQGRVVWVRNDAVLVQSEAGQPPFAQGVMYDITDMKVAEEALRRRDAMLEAVTFAAERFLKTGSWEECAEDVLARLGEAAGASRAYVFRNERADDGGVLMTQLHEWVAPGVSPTIDDPLNIGFPYRAGYERWEKELEAGRPIHGFPRDCPELEREEMERQGIVSITVAPVCVGDEWWGFMGFDDCWTEREWSEPEIEDLMIAAGILGAAIGRTRSEEELAGLNAELESRVMERTVEVQEARAFLAGVIEASPAVIFRGVPDGRSVYVSPNVGRIMGYRPEEVVGVPGWWLEHTHPDDRAATRAEIQRAADERQPQTEIVLRLRCKDGAYRWFYWVLRHEFDGQDRRVSYLGVALDITDRKRAEDALVEAKEEAELANRAKSEFLSRASHELRTPLNAILGFGQLLEMSAALPDDRDSLEQIIKAGRHLLGLVDELLDISRIDSGWLSLSIEPVAIDEVVHETLDLVLPQGLERDIQLHAETLQPSLHVMADRQRLRQVLLNLLSNAIKYNREGGHVTVSSERIGDESVALRVTDTGPGIPPERIDLLFSAFERLGAETTDQRGIGLGLALTKSLVEAMGGAIRVQSEVGVGSTFSVELLAAQEPTSVEREYASPGGVGTLGPGWTVLCIEDNFDSLHLVQRVVSRRPGVKLVAAMQGSLGVELAREHHPDLVLLDVHLPDMAGEQVLEILKEQPDTADIPVVIMSAVTEKRRVQKLLSAGARDYLAKPVDVERFLQVLDAILGSSTAAERG